MERFIRLAEAAKRLGVTQRTLVNWDASGKIETVRTPGNQRRVPESEIDRLLSQNKAVRKSDFYATDNATGFSRGSAALEVLVKKTVERVLSVLQAPAVYGLSFKHKTLKDGTMDLEYYRFADIVTGEVMAERVGEKIVWYMEPEYDEYRDVVEEQLEYILNENFLEYYGVNSKKKAPPIVSGDILERLLSGDISTEELYEI